MLGPIRIAVLVSGGGFYENIPRSIPDGLGARINKSAVRVLPIFNLIAKTGNIHGRYILVLSLDNTLLISYYY